MPDEALRAAARTGELLTAEGVLAQATRMLADPRSREVVRFFFDNLLPINALSDLERDRTLYPTFTPAARRPDAGGDPAAAGARDLRERRHLGVAR